MDFSIPFLEAFFCLILLLDGRGHQELQRPRASLEFSCYFTSRTGLTRKHETSWTIDNITLVGREGPEPTFCWLEPGRQVLFLSNLFECGGRRSGRVKRGWRNVSGWLEKRRYFCGLHMCLPCDGPGLLEDSRRSRVCSPLLLLAKKKSKTVQYKLGSPCSLYCARHASDMVPVRYSSLFRV